MRILVLILALIPIVSFADIQEEMMKFYHRWGSDANSTKAEIYKGQKAGHCTGGGITIRNRIFNNHPITVSLPKFDAGCGGIDIYAGGFSFINDQELIQALKGVGSSAAGYAFLLGLETISPQISNTIKQLQTWANNVNSFNINSCEAAAQLVGSVWPYNQQASQHICRSVGSKQGFFNDHLSARHKCAQSSENDRVNDKIKENPESADMLVGEYNIGWLAIQQQPILSKDPEIAELFMTLMGTCIIRKEQGQPTAKVLSSKATDANFLESLLQGGTLTLLKCDNRNKRQCLRPEEVKVALARNDSWGGRIRVQLLEIQKKILDDVELTDEEISLLAKSHLPIYKIINILTAYSDGYCPIDLYRVADIIAADLLNQFLRECIEMVREGCKVLRAKQSFATEIDQYIANLDHTAEFLRHEELGVSNRFEQEYQLIQKMLLLEKQIASELFCN